jgi:hypothetical protein
MKSKGDTTMQATSTQRSLPASRPQAPRGLPEVSARERDFWRREVARARERVAAGLPADTYLAALN